MIRIQFEAYHEPGFSDVTHMITSVKLKDKTYAVQNMINTEHLLTESLLDLIFDNIKCELKSLIKTGCIAPQTPR